MLLEAAKTLEIEEIKKAVAEIEGQRQKINKRLIRAARKGNIDGIRFAVEQGADINGRIGGFSYQCKREYPPLQGNQGAERTKQRNEHRRND